jgi:hypothetical protein
MKNVFLQKGKAMKSLIAVAAILVFSNLTIFASPTKTLFGGNTTVTLSSDFTGALTSLGLSARSLHPASRIRRSKVSFPIASGNLDFENAKGEILHIGGLRLSNQTTTVKLTNFIIDTTGEQPVLTGLVQANGSVVGRIKLFKLQLPALTLPLPDSLFQLHIPNVGVKLTADAAGALNQVFGTTAFVEDFNIGTASVSTFAVDI